MLAREIMSKDVLMVQPDTTIQELAKLLSKHSISGVPVADDTGRVLGVVTQADLLAKRGMNVNDIMSSEVVCVNADVSVDEVARILAEQNIKRVPVLQDGCIVGIISRGDIVRTLANAQNPMEVLGTEENALFQGYRCKSCGYIYKRTRELPESCPSCRATSEYFEIFTLE